MLIACGLKQVEKAADTWFELFAYTASLAGPTAIHTSKGCLMTHSFDVDIAAARCVLRPGHTR